MTNPKAQTPVNISQRSNGRWSVGNSFSRMRTVIWTLGWGGSAPGGGDSDDGAVPVKIARAAAQYK